ncbi:puromycin N-acetyltransferase [Echria macrotheca]|uniref:Puromycin N-acetyltransferase n=1 Tax=Echria macrotheca TaxID=438768 RepID=A0AAJ0BIU4_9PEZI|nr:puromycin N-acetyltransferase [Echria macrotheca]
MPLTLRPALEEDCPAIGRVGARAFRDTVSAGLFPPHLRALAGDIDEETPWRTARTLRRLRAGKDTIVVVDDETGAVAGFAQWERPHVRSSEAAGDEEEDLDHSALAPEDEIPMSLDRESLKSLGDLLERKAEEALGPDGHRYMWYLMILSVDPDFQRRGVGGMLLNWGLEHAKADGKPAFLVATPQGRGLYERHGFKAVSDAFDMVGTPHFSMLWTPPEASA